MGISGGRKCRIKKPGVNRVKGIHLIREAHPTPNRAGHIPVTRNGLRPSVQNFKKGCFAEKLSFQKGMNGIFLLKKCNLW